MRVLFRNKQTFLFFCNPHEVVFFVSVLGVNDMLAKFMTCQPWSRFLIYCLLNSGESCLLHPTILRGITLVRGFA